MKDDLIRSLEVIVVDDCSNDGSWGVLQRVAREDDRVLLLRQKRNLGKGAALRTALAHTTGEISIVHDANLEYNPGDIRRYFDHSSVKTRKLCSDPVTFRPHYRRALTFLHTLFNKALIYVSNLFKDLNLSGTEICYKAIRTTLFQSIQELVSPWGTANCLARISQQPATNSCFRIWAASGSMPRTTRV